jgi:hypothetical protein
MAYECGYSQIKLHKIIQEKFLRNGSGVHSISEYKFALKESIPDWGSYKHWIYIFYLKDGTKLAVDLTGIQFGWSGLVHDLDAYLQQRQGWDDGTYNDDSSLESEDPSELSDFFDVDDDSEDAAESEQAGPEVAESEVESDEGGSEGESEEDEVSGESDEIQSQNSVGREKLPAELRFGYKWGRMMERVHRMAKVGTHEKLVPFFGVKAEDLKKRLSASLLYLALGHCAAPEPGSRFVETSRNSLYSI